MKSAWSIWNIITRPRSGVLFRQMCCKYLCWLMEIETPLYIFACAFRNLHQSVKLKKVHTRLLEKAIRNVVNNWPATILLATFQSKNKISSKWDAVCDGKQLNMTVYKLSKFGNISNDDAVDRTSSQKMHRYQAGCFRVLNRW